MIKRLVKGLKQKKAGQESRAPDLSSKLGDNSCLQSWDIIAVLLSEMSKVVDWTWPISDTLL